MTYDNIGLLSKIPHRIPNTLPTCSVPAEHDVHWSSSEQITSVKLGR